MLEFAVACVVLCIVLMFVFVMFDKPKLGRNKTSQLKAPKAWPSPPLSLEFQPLTKEDERVEESSRITVTIQIGNSDNKLTQNEWAHYCAAVKLWVEKISYDIHFSGGSDWDAPWQNACLVINLNRSLVESLKQGLTDIRKNFKQDSIAITCGVSEFI